MDNKYKVLQDPIYGYLRIDPIPTQEEVEKYYKEEFYSINYKSFNDSSLEVQEEEADFMNSRWESVEFSEEIFGKIEELSVFDIGFGYAQALLYFQERGMNVSGIEPSFEGYKHAKDKGLEVYQSGIEDFDCVGNKRFNIVTIFNVLEHLRNPAQTLIEIKEKLLKNDGLLVIDVPNEFNAFQTAANNEYNLNEWWVCPPNHINYFSATSLKKLLHDCGYEVKYCESSFPLEMFMLMGDVYVGNSQLGRQCHNKRVKFEFLMKKHGHKQKLKKFYQSLAELDLGRQITIYARPIEK